MRVNSASSQIGPVLSYIANYFHKGYHYEVCFIYKMFNKSLRE